MQTFAPALDLLPGGSSQRNGKRVSYDVFTRTSISRRYLCVQRVGGLRPSRLLWRLSLQHGLRVRGNGWSRDCYEHNFKDLEPFLSGIEKLPAEEQKPYLPLLERWRQAIQTRTGLKRFVGAKPWQPTENMRPRSGLGRH